MLPGPTPNCTRPGSPPPDGKVRFCAAGDPVPMDGVVRKGWREAVVDDKGRIERIPYGLCVLVALRDVIRRREIYAEGGRREVDAVARFAPAEHEFAVPPDALPGAS